MVNISASPSNEFFGRVNLVDTAYSSVCEILFDLVRTSEEWKKSLDKDLATILLTGILAETESFLSSSTTARAFETASRLQELGAAHSDIIEHLFKQKSYADVKVLGRILGNLELDTVHQMAWASVGKSDFELVEANPEDIDDWTDQLLRHANGADTVILLVEHPEKTIIQLRFAEEGMTLKADLLEKTGLTGSTETVKNGLDFEIPKKSIMEIQMKFLRALADTQEERLGLSPGTKIEKAELSPRAQDSVPKKSQASGQSSSPAEPKNVPFEVPGEESEK